MSGKLTQITGERINQRNIKEIFEKLNTGDITIEKANGMSEEKLHELGILALYTTVGRIVIKYKNSLVTYRERSASLMTGVEKSF